jgi:hypothetical protein
MTFTRDEAVEALRAAQSLGGASAKQFPLLRALADALEAGTIAALPAQAGIAAELAAARNAALSEGIRADRAERELAAERAERAAVGEIFTKQQLETIPSLIARAEAAERALEEATALLEEVSAWFSLPST